MEPEQNAPAQMDDPSPTGTNTQVLRIARDPEAQASALLAIGSLAWKGVSAWSNVTFLVSLREENLAVMFQFFQSTGWWILMALGIAWFVQRATHPQPAERMSPGWPMVGSVAIVAFLFGALLAIRSSGSVPNVVAQWGGDINHCISIIDTSRLVVFRSKYKIASVCGVVDPSVEKLDDQRITVSNLFEIVAPSVNIVAEGSEAMRRAANLLAQAQPMQTITTPNQQTNPQRGQQQTSIQIQPFSVNMWFEAVLIPNDVDRSKIANLRDVIRLGGKIVREAYWN